MAARMRKGKRVPPTDPQCGRAVELESAVKLTWEGKTFFFCSEKCRRRYEQDPPGDAGL